MNNYTQPRERKETKMIDVGHKPNTNRVARASGNISTSVDTLKDVISGKMEKGDVLSVAQTAGIIGAKKTPSLIPLCHPISLDGVDVDFEIDQDKGRIKVIAEVKSTGKTGVEMEALTACSVALLTIYDMCKSKDKSMEIKEIHLLEKRGGTSGRWKKKIA